MLVAASRRHSRVRDEAEDLAHDIIVAALRRGLVLEGDAFVHGIDASARRHAAFVARSAARQRAREVLSVLALVADNHEPDGDALPSASLPLALRVTLLLLSLGHTKPELCSALGISDAALRKRLQGLRQRTPLARPRLAEPSAGSAALRCTQLGALRHLAPRVRGGRGSPRLIAVSDPDGHGIILSAALTNGRGTATSNVSLPRSGNETPLEGKPC